LIPLPPLSEQERIVAKIDQMMALCDQLKAQLTIGQSENRRLLEAILHRALNDDPVFIDTLEVSNGYVL
jgi:type I restriction enzyme S subunit